MGAREAGRGNVMKPGMSLRGPGGADTPLSMFDVDIQSARPRDDHEGAHIEVTPTDVIIRDVTIFLGRLTPWGAIRWGVRRLLRWKPRRRPRKKQEPMSVKAFILDSALMLISYMIVTDDSQPVWLSIPAAIVAAWIFIGLWLDSKGR